MGLVGGALNWVIFKVPSSLKHSVILRKSGLKGVLAAQVTSFYPGNVLLLHLPVSVC